MEFVKSFVKTGKATRIFKPFLTHIKNKILKPVALGPVVVTRRDFVGPWVKKTLLRVDVDTASEVLVFILCNKCPPRLCFRANKNVATFPLWNLGVTLSFMWSVFLLLKLMKF